MQKKPEKEEAHLAKKIALEREAATLLLENETFIADVQEIRLANNIPKDGLASTKKHKKTWNHTFELESDKYEDENWPAISQQIRALRDDDTLEAFEKAEQLQKSFNENVPINRLRNQIAALIRKHNLPSTAFDAIKGYVLRNILVSLHGFIGGSVLKTNNEKTGQPEIHIVVQANTTQKDIEQLWPMVKILQEKLSSRRQEKPRLKPQLERDLKIHKQLKSGKSAREIADESPSAEVLTYDDVNKIESRMRKRI